MKTCDSSNSPQTTAPPCGDQLFLTEAELAERWRIEPKTLRNWRGSGIGPLYLKVGGAVRYALADVLEFERTHKFISSSERFGDA